MIVMGLDFTSRPTERKSLACAIGQLSDSTSIVEQIQHLANFGSFEQLLEQPGPWCIAIDFPFGFAKKFVETIGWPRGWQQYVGHLATLTREEFRIELSRYREARPYGDREHKRRTDTAA